LLSNACRQTFSFRLETTQSCEFPHYSELGENITFRAVSSTGKMAYNLPFKRGFNYNGNGARQGLI